MFVYNFLKKHRRISLGLIDAVTICMSHFLGVFAVNQAFQVKFSLMDVLGQNILFVLLSIGFMWLFGVYRNVWRYARIRDFGRCISGNVLGAFFCWGLHKLTGNEVSESRILIATIFSICFVIIIRILYIYISNEIIALRAKANSDRKRILIIGAGYAGAQMSEEFIRHSNKYEVVGFVDDNKEKYGRIINGIKILGKSEDIPKIVEKHNVQVIALAIPSISAEDKTRIAGICSETMCDLKILPNIANLIKKDA